MLLWMAQLPRRRRPEHADLYHTGALSLTSVEVAKGAFAAASDLAPSFKSAGGT
jgi:hypothetical protein